MKRILKPLVILALASILMAACVAAPPAANTKAPASSGASAAKTTQKVTVALPGFENNLTPFTLSFGAFPNTHDLITLVYDTLFWSQNDVNPEPWLAESAEPSTDFKMWTVKLQKGATWHDGKPVTAEDIKFTFEYYSKFPGASGRYAHHVNDVPPFDKAEVVDEKTVRLFFKTAAPTFKILPGADLPIIPKHVWENVAEPSKQTQSLPIGSGPFKVVEIVPDQKYRLVANENYFKGKPMIDELILPIVKDPAAAFAALQTGQVDFVARNVPPELVEQFKSVSGIKVVTGTRFESIHINFNGRKEPLTNAKVRKAMMLATDNAAMLKTVLAGKGRPGLDTFLHPDGWMADPDGKHVFDPAAANTMLDEAGYTSKDTDGVRKSATGKRLEFVLMVSSFEPLDIRASQMFAEQQKTIGIKIKVESLDPATLRKRRQPAQAGGIPDYDAYIASLESHGHIDPDGIYYFYHSPGKKGFGAGVTGMSDPRLDALAEQATTQTDIEARKKLIHEMQHLLAEDAPSIVLYYPDGVYAYRSEVYDGWVNDPGHGIFTKRSFLSGYKK